MLRSHLLRYLHLAHRWLGIAFGVLMLLWIVSGVVMLFVAWPQLNDEERLRALPEIAPEAVRISPLAAWRSLDRPGWPDDVRLNVAGDRPVYRFRSGTRWDAVDAGSGARLPPLDSAQAEALARQFLRGIDFSSPRSELIDGDQWTVTSRFNAWRPFYRVEAGDGDGHEVYVARDSGEIVLDTVRTERLFNWIGSVIHWLYFAPLRQAQPLWRDLVLWLSFAATVMTASGLWLGVQRLRLRQRYGGGRVSPYRDGWKRWHHLLGLAGGVLLLTWILSGWLSLAPFGWLKNSAPSAAERQQLAGGELDAAVLGERPPDAWLRSSREIRWLRFDGRPLALRLDAKNQTLWHLPASTTQSAGQALTLAEVTRSAPRLRHDAALIAADSLSAADGDYFPRRHRPRKFPVIRLRFDDAAATVFYVDPASGQIEAKVDTAGRWHRWLFGALHRLDFPPVGATGPGRDALVVVFSTLAAALSIGGCVLGWRRIRRRARTPDDRRDAMRNESTGLSPAGNSLSTKGL